MGGYERHSAPWALDEHLLDRIPADFNGRLLEEDWPRFEEIADELAAARAGDGGGHGHAADQRPRGVHARQRVLPRRDRRARLLRRRRLLRPRARRRRRDRQGDGRVDRRRRAGDGRVGDGHPPLRLRTTARPRYTLKRTKEVYETYYDIRYPGHERQAGPAAARLERLPVAPRARRRVRREVGLGAGQLVRVQRRAPATRRCARGAGPGCTGRRRSAPSTAPRASAAGLFDESSFAKLEVSGPGAAELLERLCDNRVARDVGQRSPTRRCSTAAAGSSATSRSRALAEDALPDRHRHRVRQPRRRLDPPPPARRRQRRAAPTSPRAGPASRLWGPRAREILAPLTPDPLDFGYMRMREIAVGDVPVRALRVTFVGELGWELYCPAEYGRGAVAHAVGGRPRRTGCSRAATARSTRCGWRRATACGPPTSPPTRPRSRPGSASASRTARRSSALGAGRRRRRRAAAAAALRGARRSALGGARQRAGAGRRRGRSAA